MCRGLDELLKIKGEIPRRLFSMRVYRDSKTWERLERRAVRVVRDFCREFSSVEEPGAVLAELGIVPNPQHIFLSGDISFKYKYKEFKLKDFYPDLGISTEMVGGLELTGFGADYLITIENLIPYYYFIHNTKDNFLALYLGGYHNTLRRRLLKKIWDYCRENHLEMPFYHWGDIDYGGFQILTHLKEKTGIPLKPWRMDMESLKAFEHQGVKINNSYRSKLNGLLKKPEYECFFTVISYMLQKGVRLEQEAMLV